MAINNCGISFLIRVGDSPIGLTPILLVMYDQIYYYQNYYNKILVLIELV